MKYIVGASLGGLFGLGAPIMMDVELTYEEGARIEDSQRPDITPTIPPSQSMQHLPDDICRYIKLEEESIKEQAKECLNHAMPAVPAI